MKVNEAARLIHCIAERGPTPAMYANLGVAFKVLHNYGISEGEIQEGLVVPSHQVYDGDIPGDVTFYNFIATVFNQSHGHPGDWELLSKMYAAYDQYYTAWKLDLRPAGKWMIASRWDDYFLSLPAAQAVYNREKYLMEEIGKLIKAHKVTKVLDIACGNGRLIKKLAVKYPNCIFTGVDMEETGIRAAEDGRPNNCAFGVMNALKTLPTDQYDLVVSAGLCDYLDDRHFTRLVRRIEQVTNPKYVILGNMATHDAIPVMELCKWSLIYRDHIHLLSLAVNSFIGSRFRVGREDLGINLFLHIEPKE